MNGQPKAMCGYYSIIQYCPDPGRAEAVNVGLALLCAEAQFLRAKTIGKNNRVTRVFGKDNVNLSLLNESKENICKRIDVEKEGLMNRDAFAHFAATRANDLLMTEPRFVKVYDPEATLEQLMQQLVEPMERGGTDNVVQAEHPELTRFKERLEHDPVLAKHVQTDYEVVAPVTGEKLKFRYSLRNGTLKLIEPTKIQDRLTSALNHAKQLAYDGYSLQKHQIGEAVYLLLADQNEKTRDKTEAVRSIFQEFQVRTVLPDEFDAFAEELKDMIVEEE